MQLADTDPGLSGFKLKKLGKTLKKLAKPLVHAGAAVATGGASIPISATILKTQAEVKATKASTKAIQQASAPPPAARAPRSIAPAAMVVTQQVPQPAFLPDYYPAPTPQSASTSGLPAWALPAGGAALVAVLLLATRRG